MSKLDAIAQERAKINEQLAELEKREAAILEEEKPTAIARINADIARYRITAKELRFESESRATRKEPEKSPKQKVSAKYRNPETGDTWSGRGTPPNWVPKNKAERDKFLIPKA
jgi:DNA-binding protein H-NS